jgi:hypothetical protein
MPKPWVTRVLLLTATCCVALVLFVPASAVAARTAGRGSTVSTAAPPPQAATAGTSGKAGQLVGKVFNILRDTTVGTGANALVGGALGGLLQLAQQVGIKVPESEFEQSQRELGELRVQITELQGQLTGVRSAIAKSHASQLLHSTDPTTSQIDHALNQMKFIAENPNAKETPNMAQKVAGEIDTKLSTAPAYFNRVLNSDLADNPIKATSQALALSSRFFGQRQSDQIRTVYDYFATYEAELAVLLTNYWNTTPTIHSPKYIKEQIDDIKKSVAKTEADSLRSPVPAGTFIDTETPRLMWGTENQTVDAAALVEQDLQTRKNLGLLGLHDWQIPSFPDFSKLVSGAKGNPREWLQSGVTVPLSHQLLWGSGSVTKHPPIVAGPYRHRFKRVQVRVFDLNTGKEEQYSHNGSKWMENTSCNDLKKCLADTKNSEFRDLKRFLQSKRAGLLLLRHIPVGVSYWWTEG